MNKTLLNNKSFAFSILIFFIGIGLAWSDQTVTIVVPNDLENVEGDSQIGEGFEFISHRSQIVYPATQFTALDGKPHLLTRIARRPDYLVDAPLTSHISNCRLYASATKVGIPLNSIFSNNITLPQTLVYDGAISHRTKNIGPASGPKEFDYITDFQTPFLYDPNEGNLLLDFVTNSGWNSSPRSDMHNGQNNEWIGSGITAFPDENAPGANHSGGIVVTEFTFVKVCEYKLMGDLNYDCVVNLLDLGIMADNWLKDCLKDPEDPSCQLE